MYLDYSKLEFDANGLPETPQLVLKTLGDKMIGIIPGVHNLKLNIKFSEPSEMTFNIPAALDGEPTPFYDDVTGYKQIYTKCYGVYVIMNPETEADGIMEVKHVTGYSYEKTLESKKLFLEEGTFNFWNPASPTDTVLGRILEVAPGWSSGYVSPSLIGKYRTFDQYDDYLLSFMYNSAPEKYRCVFVFDTYKKTINVYDADEEHPTLPIYLDFDNLIESIGVEEKSNELVTAIRPYGADELSIRNVNPIGTNWIYDLSYFIANGDIREPLASKWVSWQRSILNRQEYYRGLSGLRASATARLIAARATLTDLRGELDTLTAQQSVTIQAQAMEITAEGKAYQQSLLDDINRKIATKKSEVAVQENTVSSIESELDPTNPSSYAGQIQNIAKELSSLTYNGNSQSPTWSNYDSAQLTLGGTTSGTNATSYNAAFTPKADYMWSDGSTSAKTVSWSIGKAAGSMTLSASSVTLNASNLTKTVTVSRPGDGTVTATSSNISVATVSVSGTTVTIKHVNQTTGTATITIKVAAGTNHTAPANKTVAVTAQFMPTKKTLNDQTWAEIRQVSDAGKGAEYWKVGDCKGITINGTVGTLAVNTTLYSYILGFNHNSAKEGAGIQFGTFKSALNNGVDVCLIDGSYNGYKTDGTKLFNMNHWGNYNYGGWIASDLRYDILGSTNKAPSGYGAAKTTSAVGYDAPANTATSPVANTLMAALPADLRAVMKPITKYTDAVGNASNVAANVKTSVDYLPLLAEFEIFGTHSYANQYEQNSQLQYDYYKAGNSKVKYRHSATGSTAVWWERSPNYNNSTGFCGVNTNGTADSSAARYSYGLAPAFMV